MSEIFSRNILDDKVKYNITLEKIEKESDSYTLPEFNERQEGVANWFKQMWSLDLKALMEFPEGFYSVRDTMEEISKNEEALEITSKALKLATNFDIKPGIGMWDMLKTMKPELWQIWFQKSRMALSKV